MDAMADPEAHRIDDEDIDSEMALITTAMGNEIRAWRGRRNKMSQEELARKTGMDKKTIGRLERGERPMILPQLYKICRALGIKPSVLIEAAEAEVGIE